MLLKSEDEKRTAMDQLNKLVIACSVLLDEDKRKAYDKGGIIESSHSSFSREGSGVADLDWVYSTIFGEKVLPVLERLEMEYYGKSGRR